jgi:hypothetical protein
VDDAFPPPVVSYGVGDDTVVQFEVVPSREWVDASPDPHRVIEQVKAAVEPAVQSARAVLERARAMGPDEVEVKFGIKVSGTATWLVAKAATEGNFEITMTWKSVSGAGDSNGG